MRRSVWRAPLANETDDWSTYRARLWTARDGMGTGMANGWNVLGLDRPERSRFGIDSVLIAFGGFRAVLKPR